MIAIRLLISSLILTACGPYTNTTTTAEPTHTGVTASWPDQPDRQRVRYLHFFDDHSDLGLKPRLKNRFRDFFAGKKAQNLSRPYAIAVDDWIYAVADPSQGLIHIYDIC